jgi:hypothetical protein
MLQAIPLADSRKKTRLRATARRSITTTKPGSASLPERRGANGIAPAFDDVEAIDYDRSAGWSSLVARWAHNPKVGGSNPPPATKGIISLREFGLNRETPKNPQ